MRILILVLSTVLLASASSAQPPAIQYNPEYDGPIGSRNPNAPSQTAQFDFVIGDWDVDMRFRPPGQDEQRYRARWHNFWAVNGYVVAQEWRGPYATGLELRRFNPQSGQWEGRNTYSFNTSWAETTATWIDGEMVVRIAGGSDARG